MPLVKYYYYALPQKLCKFLVDSGIGYGRLLSVMKNLAKNIVTHSVSFVYASELIEELSRKIQNELWDNCPHSFGDCNFSLISPTQMKNWIEDTLDFDMLSDKHKLLIEEIFETLNTLKKKGLLIELQG